MTIVKVVIPTREEMLKYLRNNITEDITSEEAEKLLQYIEKYIRDNTR